MSEAIANAPVLLFLFSLRLPGAAKLEHSMTFPRLAGLAIAIFGLVPYLTIAALAGRGWFRAEPRSSASIPIPRRPRHSVQCACAG